MHFQVICIHKQVAIIYSYSPHGDSRANAKVHYRYLCDSGPLRQRPFAVADLNRHTTYTIFFYTLVLFTSEVNNHYFDVSTFPITSLSGNSGRPTFCHCSVQSLNLMSSVRHSSLPRSPSTTLSVSIISPSCISMQRFVTLTTYPMYTSLLELSLFGCCQQTFCVVFDFESGVTRNTFCGTWVSVPLLQK